MNQRRNSSEYSNSYSYGSSTMNIKKEDIPKDEESKARGRLYKLLFSYPLAILAIIPSVAVGAGPICVFVFFGKILNNHTEHAITGIDNLDSIGKWCLYMVILTVVVAICKFLDTYLWIRIGSTFTNNLKSQLFESLMRNEVAFYDVTSVGSILTLLGEDTQLVQDNFGTTKGTQCQNIGQFFVGTILCYVYNWKLALVSTCIIPYAIIVIKGFSSCIEKHITKKYYYTSQLMTMSEESLAAIRTVRGFNQEDYEYERFQTTTDNIVHENIVFGRYITAMLTLVILGVWAAIIGNMYFGGTLIDKGELEGGDLMSVFGFMMMGTMGIIMLQTSMQAEQKAISSGARILRMIEYIPSIPFSGGDIIDDFKGHIEFRNVSFKYPTRDVYVLRNVSFVIKPGEMGALVGHSGSGKSTCVQLLERYYDATEGCVLLDGRDITTLDPRWLHQKISLVSQEPMLFQ
ncbi:ABC transporter family protein [Tritrichomonas foetus]|uniref:ABC transporter family protein n=1 Tax=Tritrichomonas foetus TaxID=1144522 RepID=A0A1J4J7N3_9EUKA|nr:ABC transporter family protein [Tritrichomonas foetus]|eukprot:OHS94665.1 ABC transporter family protein [Tritrichomonas foetus]